MDNRHFASNDSATLSTLHQYINARNSKIIVNGGSAKAANAIPRLPNSKVAHGNLTNTAGGVPIVDVVIINMISLVLHNSSKQLQFVGR